MCSNVFGVWPKTTFLLVWCRDAKKLDTPALQERTHIIFYFLGRGEGREKEKKRNINVWLPLTCPLLGTWPAIQDCALIGN